MSVSAAEIDAMIARAASKAAKEAVEAAFGSLGLNPTDPDHISAWHADRLWTRSAREGSTRVQTAVKTCVAGTLVTALLYGIWRLIESSGTPPSP
jgi:hypothetical protein